MEVLLNYLCLLCLRHCSCQILYMLLLFDMVGSVLLSCQIIWFNSSITHTHTHTHLAKILGRRWPTLVLSGGAPLDVNPPDHVTQAWISPTLFDILFPEGFGLLWAASEAADTVPALPSHKANNSTKTHLTVPYLWLDLPHTANLWFQFIALDVTGRRQVVRWRVISDFAVISLILVGAEWVWVTSWLRRWSIKCCWMRLSLPVLSC